MSTVTEPNPLGCFCYQPFKGSGPGVIFILCGFVDSTRHFMSSLDLFLVLIFF